MKFASTLALSAAVLTAQQFHGGGTRLLPAEHPAIQYYKTPASNRVSRLAAKLDNGQAALRYDRDHGYLPALLASLDVPVSSQTLVFSKTSFQAARISPRLPRAIYHNEDTYVGFVRGGDILELAVMDPALGIAFYSLDQGQTERPRLRQRGDECLQCHHAAVTAGVPGLMVRSIVPDRGGTPVFPGPSHITDHRSPFNERWGGWYATGTHGTAHHMGNVYVEKGEPADSLDPSQGANVEDLQRLFDAGAYLAPHSDIPSLMVMEHQTRMANLIARAAWTYRIDGAVNAAQIEELVRYMLFAGEAKLEAPVRGVSSFARDFSRRGSRDKTGRSLWQLDLEHRLLTYPCSYLIYSESFDRLLKPVKDAIYARLLAALTGKNKDGAHLSAADRLAIREILIDTKRDLRAAWGLTLLRANRSKPEHARLVASLMSLDERIGLSPEEVALAELLTLIIKDYENKSYPLPRESPAEPLKALMEDRGLKHKDIWPVLGNKGWATAGGRSARPKAGV